MPGKLPGLTYRTWDALVAGVFREPPAFALTPPRPEAEPEDDGRPDYDRTWFVHEPDERQPTLDLGDE